MLGWIKRWKAGRRLSKDVGIWYHADYAAPGLSRTGRIPGVEPFRGEIILGQLAVEKLLQPGDVRSPRPVQLKTLARVHAPEYLETTFQADTLARIFGLDTEVIDVDELLKSQRRAVGGTVAAALGAAFHDLSAAVNLGGGFHHAEPATGGGFCVYNDIAVAIAVLRRKGFRAPIAIVDLDYHQGNGNLKAFARDASVFTYSLHGSVWDEVEAVSSLDVTIPPGSSDRAYLARLEETLPQALAAHRPGLVFYVAGNDVLDGDRLGDLRLTPAGVLERDRRVAQLAKGLDAPLVVTLGGGYSPQAWECTTNFLRWVLVGEARAERHHPDRARRHAYRRVARTLDPYELQREKPEDDFDLEHEIMEELAGRSQARRFLDYYTLQGIEYALERYGLLAKVRDRGFYDLRLSADVSDRWRQVVRIHGRKKGGDDTFHLLVEVVARRAKVPAPSGVTPNDPLEVLYVEWLLLQDPTASFNGGRPRLPGQEHPGLGLAGEVLEALVQVCHRLGLDGMYHRPAHFHNALVADRFFFFLDCEEAARFEALRRVVGGLPLSEATRAVEGGRIRYGDGAAFEWHPADYVMPVSPRLKAYFQSDAWRSCCGRSARHHLEAGLHLAAHSEAAASGA